MQAIPSRVESEAGTIVGWLSHNAIWLGAVLLAFFLGMAVNNGDATKGAVTSVQTQYQGKLDYHVQNEKVIAKTAKSAINACEHNLGAALSNDAAPEALRGCPPTPPVVKAITTPATK